MSFKFEDSYLKHLAICKRVNRLRVSSTILVKLTFLASGATLLMCLPTSLGGHFSKIKVVKREKPEGSSGVQCSMFKVGGRELMFRRNECDKQVLKCRMKKVARLRRM